MNQPSGSALKYYYIWTIGCQMNQADTRRLSSQLEALGYVPASQPEKADLAILNTCVIRQHAEDKIYGRLGSLKTLKARRPELTIGVMGCLVGIHEATGLRQKFPFVDVFMPPSDPTALWDYLEAHNLAAAGCRGHACRDLVWNAQLRLPASRCGQAVTAFVPVVLGCSHACSFCVIPSRRGRERSRPPSEILAEIQALIEQGVKEVTLLGQIVDRYGQDLEEDMDLADLLSAVHELDGLTRIRFLTNHPAWMADKLLDTVAGLEKVCPHLEVPVQAGSDEVLARMRRGYTAGQFRELAGRIRARIPDAAINTDVIVGFCGETEAQFRETYQLLAELCFDQVHIAKYSPRPGTAAAKRLADDVPAVEKERRRQALECLQRDILTEKNQRYHGQTVEVLVEDKHKGRWRGRTTHNRLVFFDDHHNDLQGQILAVRIEHTSPYSLSASPAGRLALTL